MKKAILFLAFLALFTVLPLVALWDYIDKRFFKKKPVRYIPTLAQAYAYFGLCMLVNFQDAPR